MGELSRVDSDDLLAAVMAFYLNSQEFNRYPVYLLKEEFAASDDIARAAINTLVSDGSVDIVTTGNPHLRPFNSAPTHLQLSELNGRDFDEHICLYPSTTLLADAPEVERYRIVHTAESSPWVRGNQSFECLTLVCWSTMERPQL